MDSDDDWEKQADHEEDDEEKWAGEDEDDVAEDWDADPAEKEPKKVEVNNPKKLSKKQLARQQEKLERKANALTEEEKLAEALKQKAAMQKANDELIDDLFGDNDFGGDEDDAPAVDGFDRDKVKEQANDDLFGGASGDEEENEEEQKDEPMKDFKVNTEPEVAEFATFVSNKIKTAPGRKLIIKFLGDILKQTTEDFTIDDVKKVQKDLNQIYNVKRVEHNQKKQKKKKPTIKMSQRSRADDFDLDGGDYGGDDDFF
mmetsp:Transcript_4648/g.6579  ORF Transcript_4648/g.6579 Transcript_4648/m.6579 type:complete len:258 (-) Transcript_4648:192-965(-)|eukprot:CAMPEP_0184481954 /NCGR_PEP_ID=MMETSP0113_2-20130426/3552_1 /TAXON_ID=91329 /ORGANISM="Norrisiella sphaerica, Strain BC52" /LENGTH=257 /DNA_ID=CAMNT_0026861445 /DNA_START=186 /DNA_END=959 /DNA_ORIENTATION=-